MARLTYSLLLYLLLPWTFLRLYLRGAKNPAYRKRWGERLGLANPAIQSPVIWIHAVSVGEVTAALPLIHAIQREYPGYQVAVTTTTLTGSQQVTKTLNDKVCQWYFPYDLNWSVSRFLDRLKPNLIIIMERELWPNLLHQASSRGIPLLLANARLPVRSAQRYGYVKCLIKPAIRCLSVIAAQSAGDAERFLQLGAKKNTLILTGNTKYDVFPTADYKMVAAAIRQAGDFDRPVWIAASTHKGEEEFMLQAHKRLLQQLPNALLILAPRHPERFAAVYQRCLVEDLQTVRRSLGSSPTSSTQVFLGDTMGELYALYELAKIAFVGGSLVRVGGHNILEPALLGKVVVFGPYMSNFAEISGQMLANQAAIQVPDASELALRLAALFADPITCAALGNNAKQMVLENRGAVARTCAIVRQLLEH